VDGTDPANARKQRDAQHRFNARARELAAVAPPADLVADTIASAAALPVPTETPVGGTVIPNPQAAEIIAAMVETPEDRDFKRYQRDVAADRKLLEQAERYERMMQERAKR
jgi:hypothetical protein